jgi:hypothetical protein
MIGCARREGVGVRDAVDAATSAIDAVNLDALPATSETPNQKRPAVASFMLSQ